ncbi:unnamed protein product [Rotaria sp. Silwood1]|nr:unnamed protein product [Rotaria sp. Silwood1]CAF1311927.1 unnamed protein product [Rotaria sp. Silwood1]CAF3497887.1 unnamed protein product [Rotaria sp. Silwood1]CAF3545279.1 unnamed protein product [Rotaria sp. Silwood1]CAF3550561.1 unnamed protein product [Rotaria sp. Silwood1]
MLNNPRGIFVDINSDLYVADYSNKRVQLFKSGQLTATTVAGKGAPSGSEIIGPTSVMLSTDGTLYIVDNDKHRIVEWGSTTVRCVVACSNAFGSKPIHLHYPYNLATAAETTSANTSFGNAVLLI